MGYLQDASSAAERRIKWAFDEAHEKGRETYGAYPMAKSRSIDGGIRTEVVLSITDPFFLTIAEHALRQMRGAYETGYGTHDRDARNPGRPFVFVLRK